MNFKPIDLTKVKTISIVERKNKVNVHDFAKSPENVETFERVTLNSFIHSLPDILVGRDFKELVEYVARASKEGKTIVIGIGGHVIKCGLAPVLSELMRKGIISAVAMNGAAAIHDSEIAMIGATSEDVAEGLETGMFGMSKETAEFINGAAKLASEQQIVSGKKLAASSEQQDGELRFTIHHSPIGIKEGLGFGRTLGRLIDEERMPYREYSILWNAYKCGIPATVHVAIGTDIVHQHPSCDGAAVGEASYTDFRIFCSVVASLEGGAYLNFGSAVILPEVFLKALTVARNLGYQVRSFVTANFDMIQHYRPRVNVVDRPTRTGGKGYAFTGHHEIMIPLFVWAVLDQR